jgi:hypothetical protein
MTSRRIGRRKHGIEPRFQSIGQYAFGGLAKWGRNFTVVNNQTCKQRSLPANHALGAIIELEYCFRYYPIRIEVVSNHTGSQTNHSFTRLVIDIEAEEQFGFGNSGMGAKPNGQTACHHGTVTVTFTASSQSIWKGRQ